MKSHWFSRGWTLQELIAPSHVVFYDREWTEITTKGASVDLLATATGIEREILLHLTDLPMVNIAHRMSWASNRKTTRIEDIAYCLLGLFNVSMPLLYGEGEKAFIRLQEEIIKESGDQSIFAWEAEGLLLDEADRFCVLGVLATHPSMFKNAGNVETYPSHWQPYMMTNRGLQIQLPLLRPQGEKRLHGILQCTRRSGSFFSYLAIPLRHTPHGDGSLGREPGRPMLEIREIEAQHAKIHVAYLSKLNVPVPHRIREWEPTKISLSFYSQDLGYRLKNAIYAAKPLNSLTEYRRGMIPKQRPDMHVQFNSASIPNQHPIIKLPNDRYDYVAALHFGHVSDTLSEFLVVMESEKVRQVWQMELTTFSVLKDLETILQQRMGIRAAELPTGVYATFRGERNIEPKPGVRVTGYLEMQNSYNRELNADLVIEIKLLSRALTLSAIEGRSNWDTVICELPG
jgi:hypothetical protein